MLVLAVLVNEACGYINQKLQMVMQLQKENEASEAMSEMDNKCQRTNKNFIRYLISDQKKFAEETSRDTNPNNKILIEKLKALTDAMSHSQTNREETEASKQRLNQQAFEEDRKARKKAEILVQDVLDIMLGKRD